MARWRKGLLGLLIFVMVLAGARAALPIYLRHYVNKTIDQSPVYKGTIGKLDVQLWQGGYTIHDIRLNKTTGTTPVPFFYAKRVHLVLEWGALMKGHLVGRVVMDDPQINFVDAEDESSSQTGANGPWLEMIRDLYPFKINSALVHNGEIHLRAFDKDPPVDVYLNQIDGKISNLTNIFDDTSPLVAKVEAKGLAMNQAKFEYSMKLDPASYRPSFKMAVRLVGLDVREVNDMARAYGHFDFEDGFFDLVVELNSTEGEMQGYVKPLFRNIRVLDLKHDLAEGDPLNFFWESLIEVTTQVFKNQRRDQFGTLVPMTGELASGGPRADVLTTIGNVLRNAFIRAYLPRFEQNPDMEGLVFGEAQPLDVSQTSSEK